MSKEKKERSGIPGHAFSNGQAVAAPLNQAWPLQFQPVPATPTAPRPPHSFSFPVCFLEADEPKTSYLH